MKRSKELFEEEQQNLYQQEQAYLNAERELHEQVLMQELFEEDMREKELHKPRIILGKGRKATKFATYGRKGRLVLKSHLQYIFRKV